MLKVEFKILNNILTNGKQKGPTISDEAPGGIINENKKQKKTMKAI